MEVTLFKHRKPFMNIILKDGTKIMFANYQFFTLDYSVESKVRNAMNEDKSLGIYIDPKEPKIDPEYSSPIEKIKRDAIIEWERKKAERIDAGASLPGNLTTQTAEQVAAVVANPTVTVQNPLITEGQQTANLTLAQKLAAKNSK